MTSIVKLTWPSSDAGKYFVPVERCNPSFWDHPEKVTPGTVIKIRHRRYRVVEYRLGPNGFVTEKL